MSEYNDFQIAGLRRVGNNFAEISALVPLEAAKHLDDVTTVLDCTISDFVRAAVRLLIGTVVTAGYDIAKCPEEVAAIEISRDPSKFLDGVVPVQHKLDL